MFNSNLHWSAHFQIFCGTARPFHPLIEGHLDFSDAMGLEMCSSIIGQTRPEKDHDCPLQYTDIASNDYDSAEAE